MIVLKGTAPFKALVLGEGSTPFTNLICYNNLNDSEGKSHT